MTLRERFGSTIGRLRVAANLSQEKLAELTGLHATTISAVERGRTSVTLETLEALARGLAISPWDLVRVTATDARESSFRFTIVAERTSAGYSAYCPDLPGCAAIGESREDVEHAIRDAITAELQNLRRSGSPIPEPASYTTVVSVTL